MAGFYNTQVGFWVVKVVDQPVGAWFENGLAELHFSCSKIKSVFLMNNLQFKTPCMSVCMYS